MLQELPDQQELAAFKALQDLQALAEQLRTLPALLDLLALRVQPDRQALRLASLGRLVLAVQLVRQDPLDPEVALDLQVLRDQPVVLDRPVLLVLQDLLQL